MSKDPHLAREQAKYDNPVASREHLLATIKKAAKALSFIEICSLVSANDEESRIGIQRRLRAMEREGQVSFNRQKKYELVSQAQLIRGRVIGHKDGFGFLKYSDTEKDLFIHQGQMQALLHDDIVEGIEGDSDRRGRREFRVNRVIQTRQDPIVGRYYTEQGVGLVIPDDNRICQEIIIPKEQCNGARQGHVVVVEITQRPSRKMNAIGKISEVLGEHLAPGMEIETALRNFDIPHQWPKGVSNAVAKLADQVPESAKEGRVDLRDLPLVTIDGEDARDFDDAVYCRPSPEGGWTLWVAIADVSAYVKPGTALDEEAKLRGTSVYFPEQVIPMLPEVLSNGLCSINPDVDRLCMVCEVKIDAQGKAQSYQFYEAVMKSHARLTYNKVWSILTGDESLRKRYAQQVDDLEQLYALYKVLNKSRQQRGAIEFETIESKFVFNAQRKISHIVPVERNDAHKLIEECMIMANVCAAEFLEKHQAYGLFRIHDKPDEDRLLGFKTYLQEVGIPTGFSDEPTPSQFSSIIKKIANRPDKELIQTMLLRSMKQAVYDPDNVGHFGLALAAYAHFTSPIRRYPDLVVHRAIKAILDKQAERKSKTGGKAYSLEEVDILGEQCSMAERRADDATRDVADWLKCEFMQDHVGECFDGVVASVTNFGLFVRITEYHIDGLVHITSLGNDYYHHDEARQMLVGESSGITYRLGDQVKVKVAAVNLDDRKIDLLIDGIKQIDRKAKKSSRGKGAPKLKVTGTTKPPSKSKQTAKKTPGRKKAGPKPKKTKGSKHRGK